MANVFKKPIREYGIIISKSYIEARPQRTGLDGKVYSATEEKFMVEVISCDKDDFNKDTGILNGSRLSYPVSKDVFDKVKFGDWANVKYTAQQYGEKLTTTPESFELIEKKQ